MRRVVVLVLIHRDGRIFLQRRPETASRFPGCWELPGGKREPGETLDAALCRELREELDWVPASLRLLGRWPGAEAPLVLFGATGVGTFRTTLGHGWFSPREALALPLIPATHSMLADLYGKFPPRALVAASMVHGNTTLEFP